MNACELIQVTKTEMINETIPLMESNDLSPSEVDIQWTVDEGDDIIVTLRVVNESTGEVIVEKCRKIQLLEG